MKLRIHERDRSKRGTGVHLLQDMQSSPFPTPLKQFKTINKAIGFRQVESLAGLSNSHNSISTENKRLEIVAYSRFWWRFLIIVWACTKPSQALSQSSVKMRIWSYNSLQAIVWPTTWVCFLIVEIAWRKSARAKISTALSNPMLIFPLYIEVTTASSTAWLQSKSTLIVIKPFASPAVWLASLLALLWLKRLAACHTTLTISLHNQHKW